MLKKKTNITLACIFDVKKMIFLFFVSLMKVIFLNILFFFFISCQSQVKDAQDIINNPDGIINDYGQIFSKNQNKILRDKLFQYHLNTNRQIIVVTVNRV